jgi:hypothetical protein
MAGIVAGSTAKSAGKNVGRPSRRSEPDPTRHPDRAQRQTFRVSRFSNGSLTTRRFPRRAKLRDILSALQPSKGCTLRDFSKSPAKRLHHPFTVSLGHHSRNTSTCPAPRPDAEGSTFTADRMLVQVAGPLHPEQEKHLAGPV